MGDLRLETYECGYKAKDRRFKEQFINNKNDEEMMTQIISEFTALKESNKVTSEQVLC